MENLIVILIIILIGFWLNLSYQEGKVSGMKEMQKLYKPLLDGYDESFKEIVKIVRSLEK